MGGAEEKKEIDRAQCNESKVDIVDATRSRMKEETTVIRAAAIRINTFLNE